MAGGSGGRWPLRREDDFADVFSGHTDAPVHSLREAFVARALEGMELREASAALQVPISTVSWRTRRAEAMLCESLGLLQSP
ncbi:hypothetical protein [Nannocystis radixulma]|uniref:RNA polymerase sigma factor 70 region 4 type 2 domain-containing protein n=1 Tax=Nannocystis radixulma TaxID=2995305 RepID=A0ABT5BE42_9BACT|nr:hypothetical protein [Nannocystis radixulma]MDC0672406.1 hypothetical protein [Nannocystis radixulma]